MSDSDRPMTPSELSHAIDHIKAMVKQDGPRTCHVLGLAGCNEAIKLREAAESLIGYALTCRRINQASWMEGLCRKINAMAVALGDSDRVATHGNGLQVITPEDVHETSGPE